MRTATPKQLHFLKTLQCERESTAAERCRVNDSARESFRSPLRMSRDEASALITKTLARPRVTVSR
jgi:hypothetical protein